MTQVEYVAILFDDVGFTGQQRRDFLAARFNGRRYADELSKSELHNLIDELKERKPKPVAVEKDEE